MGFYIHSARAYINELINRPLYGVYIYIHIRTRDIKRLLNEKWPCRLWKVNGVRGII